MIEIEGLTKFFETQGTRHYVCRDASATIPSNKSIALIGRNGAGKSTLMRMMAGAIAPDSGRIKIHGTVSWPVGLSGGFNSTLTARENCRFVCRIMGLSGAALEDRVAFVREFAEIGKFFDLPMKTYSSGMRSRVTFGLSMAFHFDYYLIDEVTSVGDLAFREKSERALKALRSQSSFVFASHNLNDLERICEVALVLDSGDFRYFDSVKEGVAHYKDLVKQKTAEPAGARAA